MSFNVPKELVYIFLQLSCPNCIPRYPRGPENPDVSHPRISPSHPSTHPQNGKFWTPPLE